MTTTLVLFIAAIFGIVFLYTFLPWLISRTPLPWLVQCLLVIAATVPLLVVEAGDLVLAFLVSSLVTVGLSHFHQRLKVRYFSSVGIEPEKFRWTANLSSLLSGLVIICAITALAVRAIENYPTSADNSYETPHLAQLLSMGLAMGIWSHSIFFFWLCRPAWKRTYPFILTSMLLSLIAASWNEPTVAQSIFSTCWFYLPNSFKTEVMIFGASTLGQPGVTTTWLVLLAVNACMMTFAAWSLGMAFSTNKSASTAAPSLLLKPIRIISILTTTLWVTGLLTPVSYFFFSLFPISSELKLHHEYLSGQPNGFTELCEAGDDFDQSAILTGSNLILPGPELKNEIAAYSSAFQKLDAGLARPNCTWIDWSTGEIFRPNAMDSMGGGMELRAAARGLGKRSLQAQADGRFDDAMADGMRALNVAKSLSIDPTAMTSLVGNAIEGMAFGMIHSAIKQASTNLLHSLVNSLDELATNFESVDQEISQIDVNEKRYAWIQSDWKGRLAFLVLADRDNAEFFHEFLIRRGVIRNLLQTEIAAELYRREVGQFPPDLKSMVPTYLSKIPIDPFSPAAEPQPLRYQASPDGSSFRLYSVGVNRVDENGQCDPGNPFMAGDINLAIIFGDRLDYNRKEVEKYEQMQAEELAEDAFWNVEPKDMLAPEAKQGEANNGEANNGEEDAGLDRNQDAGLGRNQQSR